MIFSIALSKRDRIVTDKKIFGTAFEYRIDPKSVNLSKKLIQEWFKSDSYDTEDFNSLIDNSLLKIRELRNIMCGFRIFPPEEVEIQRTKIIIEGIEFNTGNIITKRFRKSETVAIFVSTAGSELETESKEMMNKGDVLEGYLLDVIGSELAEEGGNIAENKLSELLSPFSLNITNRYSPGYCKWEVSEQQKLFSLLTEKFCGIALSESSLMTPIKSISGFIGIGKNACKEEYQCTICDVDYCFKRNKNE